MLFYLYFYSYIHILSFCTTACTKSWIFSQVFSKNVGEICRTTILNSTFQIIFQKKCLSRHIKKIMIYSNDFLQVCLIMWWVFLLNNDFETVLLPRVYLFKLKHQILSGLSNVLSKIHENRLWKSCMEEAHTLTKKRNAFTDIFQRISLDFK